MNYNPFEVGEPWATVPDADGNDVAHVKHGFDDWRIADSFYDAENAASRPSVRRSSSSRPTRC